MESFHGPLDVGVRVKTKPGLLGNSKPLQAPTAVPKSVPLGSKVKVAGPTPSTPAVKVWSRPKRHLPLVTGDSRKITPHPEVFWQSWFVVFPPKAFEPYRLPVLSNNRLPLYGYPPSFPPVKE